MILTVTILILIDGFLQYKLSSTQKNLTRVTILILIDGFLQFKLARTVNVTIELSQSLF